MSDQETSNEIGRAVVDYGNTRKELSLLLGRASQWGACLKEVSEMLSARIHANHHAGNGWRTLETSSFEIPTKQEVAELLVQISELSGKKQRLAKILKDVGAEPKD